MHGAQAQGGVVLCVGVAHVVHHLADVLLGLHEDDAGLLALLGLGLQAHDVLQLLGQQDVAHLHGQDSHAPGGHLLLQHALELAVELLAADGHLGGARAADGVAQRGLRRQLHGTREVAHLGAGGLRVPHMPEQDGVHIERHEVGRERLLGAERGHAHAGVHAHGVLLDDGPRPEQARARHAIELAQAQHHDLLPLLRDVHRHGGEHGHHQGGDHRSHADPSGEGPCNAQHGAEGHGEHHRREQQHAGVRGALAHDLGARVGHHLERPPCRRRRPLAGDRRRIGREALHAASPCHRHHAPVCDARPARPTSISTMRPPPRRPALPRPRVSSA